MRNFFLFAVVFFIGCNNAQRDIEAALHEIDEAINTIKTASSGWKDVIQQLTKDIPHEAHDIIGNDLTSLGHDIVGATGAEAKCTIAFVRSRIIQTLENLKLKLQGKPYTMPPPGFCTLQTSSLDLNSDQTGKGNLSIYGYDLNSLDTNRNRIKLVLLGDSSTKLVDESLIGRNTNYQMSVNINALLPDLLTNKYKKIQLVWNGDSVGFPQILIQKWVPKVQSHTFTPEPLSWTPPHTGGDEDFDTEDNNHTVGSIKMEFRVSKEFVEARVYMDAMEFGGNNTRVGVSLAENGGEATAWSPWTKIYSAVDDGYELTNFAPNTVPQVDLNINSKGVKSYYVAASAVSHYDVDLDDKGNEAGTKTKVIVKFNEMTFFLIQKNPGGK